MLLVGFCRADAPPRPESHQCRALGDAQVRHAWYRLHGFPSCWQLVTASVSHSHPLMRSTLCRQLDKFKLPDLITMLFALAKLGSPVDAKVAEAAAHAAGSRGITLQA